MFPSMFPPPFFFFPFYIFLTYIYRSLSNSFTTIGYNRPSFLFTCPFLLNAIKMLFLPSYLLHNYFLCKVNSKDNYKAFQQLLIIKRQHRKLMQK